MSNEPAPQTSILGSATPETDPTPGAPQAAPEPAPAAAPTSDAASPATPEADAAAADPEGGEGEKKGDPSPPLTAADLTLPEGYTLPEDIGGEFLSLLNDPPESRAELANQMLSLHTKLLQTVADEHATQWETLQQEWRTAVQSLPQIGGDNLDRSMGEIAKVLDKYGDADAREALNITGAGNHPAIVKLFHNLAKDLNERPPVQGDPAAGAPKDRASRMYGNS